MSAPATVSAALKGIAAILDIQAQLDLLWSGGGPADLSLGGPSPIFVALRPAIHDAELRAPLASAKDSSQVDALRPAILTSAPYSGRGRVFVVAAVAVPVALLAEMSEAVGL